MRTSTRVFWILTLTVFLSGCSSYRQGLVPPGTPDSGAVRGETPVRVGATVRITLMAGDKFSGTVTAMSDTSLVLGNRGNYGFEDVTVNFADIDRFEIRDQTDSSIEGQWFIGLGIALVGGFLWALSHMGLN